MNSGKALMIQGTASYVGKTILVAALCRILAQAGYAVAPFKSQNMSLNSYVTPDGKEIARAQALQAFAAGIEPRVEMNPILLKPSGDMRSQIVLMGQPYQDIAVKDYYREFVTNEGIRAVRKSLGRLLSEFEIVVIEGAGSPAELNLYDYEIANMRVAKLADAPVLLVADIDRGGVFASIVGTISLLNPADRERVKGLIINKFRGDVSILEPGLRKLEELTNKPVLGVMPYIQGLDLPWEDSVSLETLTGGSNDSIDVAVIKVPFISNFTDFHPLMTAGMRVRLVKSAHELRSPDVVMIPGTKNTVQDLVWLKKEGLDREILRLRRTGVPVIGICGGYQMLGKKLVDPYGLEGGARAEYGGLDLLDVVTTFSRYEKTTRRVRAEVIGAGPILGKVAGKRIRGYEIHMGETELGTDKPPFRILPADTHAALHPDGAVSDDGLVFGSYLHGIFDDNCVTNALLNYLAERKGVVAAGRAEDNIEKTWMDNLDLLCDTVRANVGIARIFEIAGIKETKVKASWTPSRRR